MKVQVDYAACEANAVCMGLSPTVFQVDDDDQLHLLVDEVPADQQDAVRQAVDRCPKRALSLAE